jgi:hypothetical protein
MQTTMRMLLRGGAARGGKPSTAATLQTIRNNAIPVGTRMAVAPSSLGMATVAPMNVMGMRPLRWSPTGSSNPLAVKTNNQQAAMNPVRHQTAQSNAPQMQSQALNLIAQNPRWRQTPNNNKTQTQGPSPSVPVRSVPVTTQNSTVTGITRLMSFAKPQQGYRIMTARTLGTVNNITVIPPAQPLIPNLATRVVRVI